MKQEFSNAWISSTQIRKQRKYRANAPLHIKSKMMGSHLSKELRKKYETRSVRIRKGDEVKIMIGKFKGKTGKIGDVNVKKQKVSIEGIQNKKKDGTKIAVYFNPSNLIVTTLNLEDKKRFKKKNQETKKPEKQKEAKESKKSETQKDKPKEIKEKK
ncbi:50S ribosomal protein L24 [Candidatus Pacearchaeota archaeon CG10_big_fil_rev_8_21_14_0_10_30_48]|nr:MAG: 50S ribosomal protein L24 [Candidatus Pacearchaeota archaeon CG10_big_fil_rev_8_21_14_0_10_30_48]